MFRIIIGIIVSLFMISLLRMIVGAISREMGGSSPAPSAGAGPRQTPSTAPRSASGTGGELRKCPSCGTYHSLTNVAAKGKSGELMHFCSLACREKFVA